MPDRRLNPRADRKRPQHSPSRDTMPPSRTLSILKPDATRRNLTGAINAMLEESGLRIVAQKRLRLSPDQAEAFYAVH
ncbi:MAG: nucleoside-diphosphate kinase, partial [Acetobacteraceae bacterium]